MWSQTKNPSQPRSSAAEANSASTRGSASSPNGAMSMARFTWQSLMESGGIPLRQWAAVGAPLVLTGRNLGPAVGGVLPRLLAPEHGPVQQVVRPEARLVAAVGRPVSLVDAVRWAGGAQSFLLSTNAWTRLYEPRRGAGRELIGGRARRG